MIGVFAGSHRLMRVRGLLEQPEQLQMRVVFKFSTFDTVDAQTCNDRIRFCGRDRFNRLRSI